MDRDPAPSLRHVKKGAWHPYWAPSYIRPHAPQVLQGTSPGCQAHPKQAHTLYGDVLQGQRFSTEQEWIWVKYKIFFHGAEALAQAALRSWGRPIPEGVEGQAGEASGHLDLVGGVPAWSLMPL